MEASQPCILDHKVWLDIGNFHQPQHDKPYDIVYIIFSQFYLSDKKKREKDHKNDVEILLNKTTHHTFRSVPASRSSTITPNSAFSLFSHNPFFSTQTNLLFSLFLNQPIHKHTETCYCANHWVSLHRTTPPQFISLLKFSSFFTLHTQFGELLSIT